MQCPFRNPVRNWDSSYRSLCKPWIYRARNPPVVPFRSCDILTSAAFLISPFKNMSPKPQKGSGSTSGETAPFLASSPASSFPSKSPHDLWYPQEGDFIPSPYFLGIPKPSYSCLPTISVLWWLLGYLTWWQCLDHCNYWPDFSQHTVQLHELPLEGCSSSAYNLK